MSDDLSLPDAPPQSQFDGGSMQEVQRSLGRIEGLQGQILETFKAHKEDDKTAFDIINKAFEVRDSAIAELNKKVDAMESERDKAKGAGKVILALLTASATFIGAAVLALFEGKVTIKF